MGEVTTLLAEVREGKRDAANRLFELVYGELKGIASRAVAVRAGGQLDTTGLVHECYLRLADGTSAVDRGHFFAIAARAMRQILCDQARRRSSAKRDAGAPSSVDVQDTPDALPASEELVAMDELFTRLAAVDARAAAVMECRVFGGLTVPETAEALGVSERTVHTDFTKAREWLAKAMA